MYQIHKKEKLPRDFEAEFFKPSTTTKPISNSIRVYSTQAKELNLDWKPPVFSLKPVPHFSHLFVSQLPRNDGFVFYYKIGTDRSHESMTSSAFSNNSHTRGHQSIDLADRNHEKMEEKSLASSMVSNSVERDMRPSQSISNFRSALSSPVASTTLSRTFSQQHVSTSRDNIVSPFVNISAIATASPSGNLQNKMELNLDDLYRIIQRNYFSFREFIQYSPLLIERAATHRDPELYYPANLTLRQYVNRVIFSKCKHFVKNTEIYEVWMDFIETFERAKYDNGKKPSSQITEQEFTKFLGHLYMLLNARYSN